MIIKMKEWKNRKAFEIIKIGIISVVTAVLSLLGVYTIGILPNAYVYASWTVLYLISSAVILYLVFFLLNLLLFRNLAKEKVALFNFFELLFSFILVHVIVIVSSIIMYYEGEIEVVVYGGVASIAYLPWTFVTLIKLMIGKTSRIAASVITFLILGFISLLALAFAFFLFLL